MKASLCEVYGGCRIAARRISISSWVGSKPLPPRQRRAMSRRPGALVQALEARAPARRLGVPARSRSRWRSRLGCFVFYYETSP